MKAIGLIEVRGLVAATEAADSSLKAAQVSLVGHKLPGSGLVTVILTGDVASVKAAVEAGAESAAAVGEVVAVQVIANPHKDMEVIFTGEPDLTKDAKVVKEVSAVPKVSAGQKKKSPGV